jgi:methanogenic corrinoid protein MtbC1
MAHFPRDPRTALSVSLKAAAKEIPPASASATDAFRQSFPRLLDLVNKKFVVDARFRSDALLGSRMNFLNDMHKYLGEIFRAVYEFGLSENLVDEFLWFVSAASARGFKKDYFEKMLAAWQAALHGILGPVKVRELAALPSFLARNLDHFLRMPQVSNELEAGPQKHLARLLLEKNRRDAAESVISVAKEYPSPERLFQSHLAPVLHHIGRLWQLNMLSAADEHAAFEICRYIVFRFCDSLPKEPKRSVKAFVGCVTGEEHSLAAEMTAEILNLKGWTVFFSGRSAPLDEIVWSARQFQPDIIFLSVSLIPNLPSAKDLIMALRSSLAGARIILGGSAALAARHVMEKLTDAVAENIEDGYRKARDMVTRHA